MPDHPQKSTSENEWPPCGEPGCTETADHFHATSKPGRITDKSTPRTHHAPDSDPSLCWDGAHGLPTPHRKGRDTCPEPSDTPGSVSDDLDRFIDDHACRDPKCGCNPEELADAIDTAVALAGADEVPADRDAVDAGLAMQDAARNSTSRPSCPWCDAKWVRNESDHDVFACGSAVGVSMTSKCFPERSRCDCIPGKDIRHTVGDHPSMGFCYHGIVGCREVGSHVHATPGSVSPREEVAPVESTYTVEGALVLANDLARTKHENSVLAAECDRLRRHVGEVETDLFDLRHEHHDLKLGIRQWAISEERAAAYPNDPDCIAALRAAEARFRDIAIEVAS